MKLESSHFPTKTVKEIQLDKDEIGTLKNGFIVYDTDNLLQLEWPSRNNNNGNFTYTAKEYKHRQCKHQYSINKFYSSNVITTQNSKTWKLVLSKSN